MKCYLCGKEQLKVIRNKVRNEIKRDVLECQNCGLNYLKPKKKDLNTYYTEDYRKKYTPIIGETLECQEMFNLLLPFQQARVEQIKHILKPEMSVLDVGCSTGHFLCTLKNHVKECIGIEYNQKEAFFVQNKLRIKTYSTSIEETDLPHKNFDIITFYQVLEHMEDPIRTLEIYKNYLKDDGYICVEVPNIKDILISGYKIEPFIDFWFREPHLFNFSPKTLQLVLEEAGFKGTVKGIQYYNFLNHLNWIFTGKPQKSVNEGWKKPILIENDDFDDKFNNTLNKWFEKINEKYQQILEIHKRSESLLFIGQKS